jgi:hypothetical protein
MSDIFYMQMEVYFKGNGPVGCYQHFIERNNSLKISRSNQSYKYALLSQLQVYKVWAPRLQPFLYYCVVYQPLIVLLIIRLISDK